jgi:membrane protein
VGVWFRKLGRTLLGALRASLLNQASRVAAGLAYYMSFSIAPILLITILVAGAFYAQSETDLTAQVARLIPGAGGDAVRILLEGLLQSRGTGAAAGVGIIFALVFGATGVFGALQAALDDIWGVQVRPESGLVRFISRWLFSVAMVLAVAVLLLASLLVHTFIALIVARFGGLLPGGAGAWRAVNVTLSLVTATGIFTLIFRFVPDAPVRWVPALLGGLVTAALFSVGEALLAWYLGDAARLSVYGIFGSLIVLMLWVYYSAQILLFGAEVAKIYGSMDAGPE